MWSLWIYSQAMIQPISLLRNNKEHRKLHFKNQHSLLIISLVLFNFFRLSQWILIELRSYDVDNPNILLWTRERSTSGCILSPCLFNLYAGYIMRMENRNSDRLYIFFWAPKSLQMVIAAMKLKDTRSLEEKLWPT